MGIDKMRIGCAKRMGRLVHLFRKGIGASSHMNRNCRSGIVSGRKHKAIQKLFHGQGISRVDMCQGCTRLRDDRFWSYRYHIT